MEYDLILAGVGGQGILTIAEAISLAALKRGWCVKQSEVHGMSQRGGDVQSHLRFADHEIFSDLIPLGEADMILSVEPLETLRYVQYLKPEGMIVANKTPVENITNYPPVDQIYQKITRYPRHVLIDAETLAKQAGNVRCSNIVMLGAASVFLKINPEDLESAITEIFTPKGDKIVEMNKKAFRLGRSEATTTAKENKVPC